MLCNDEMEIRRQDCAWKTGSICRVRRSDWDLRVGLMFGCSSISLVCCGLLKIQAPLTEQIAASDYGRDHQKQCRIYHSEPFIDEIGQPSGSPISYTIQSR